MVAGQYYPATLSLELLLSTVGIPLGIFLPVFCACLRAKRGQSPCLNINSKMFAPIEGFSNYRICNEGYVVKYPSMVMVIPINSRSILAPMTKYERIRMRSDSGEYMSRLVHRLVAEAFVSNVHGYIYVDHIDGDTKNNDVQNVRWVSAKQNLLNRCWAPGKSNYIHGVSKKWNRYYINRGQGYGKGVSFDNYLDAAKFRLNYEKEIGEFFRDQIPEKVTLEILNDIIDGF